jgi:hypothetical protein
VQEHLIDFFIAVLAELCVAWFLVRWVPKISDFRARRSASATKKTIARLAATLEVYEADFADMRLFVGRIARSATTFLAAAMFSLIMFSTHLTISTSGQIYCSVTPDRCRTIAPQGSSVPFGTLTAFDFVAMRSILLAITVVGLYVTLQQFGMFLLETHPNRYRSYITGRIDRLRARLN